MRKRDQCNIGSLHQGNAKRGGSMGGQLLDQKGVQALASLPSLDQLRATLVGLVNAPATKLAQLSTAPAAKLARVFGAYGAKDAA